MKLWTSVSVPIIDADKTQVVDGFFNVDSYKYRTQRCLLFGVSTMSKDAIKRYSTMVEKYAEIKAEHKKLVDVIWWAKLPQIARSKWENSWNELFSGRKWKGKIKHQASSGRSVLLTFD